MNTSRPPHIKIDGLALVDDHFSGVGHYTFGIVRGIDQIASEGKVTYSIIVPLKWKYRVKKLGLRHYKRIIGNPISHRIIRQFIKRNIRFPFDLLFGIGYYYFPSFVVWPLWFSKSSVVIHDMTYVAVPEYVEDKNRQFLEMAVPFSLKQSQTVISVSKFSAKQIKSFYKLKHDVEVVYPAADIQPDITDPKKRKKEILKRFSIPHDKYVLTVGNLEPRKNHERLIDAFMSLPEEYKSTTSLVLVGAGGWKNQTIASKIKQAHKDGFSVILPKSYVTDEELSILYANAALYAFVPLYEGFGMSPLEAYAAGTPVLSSNVTSLPEAAGKPAVYADPTSTNSIKKGLINILTMGEEELARRRREADKHLHQFSWRQSAEKTLSALTKLPVSMFSTRVEK